MRRIDLSLSSILKNVLNEEEIKVEKEYSNDYAGIINKCIDRLLFLKVTYDDGKGKKGTRLNPETNKPWGNPRGLRRILPFAFYKSKQNGEDTLRAIHWNDSNTKRGPGKWKEFKVSHFKRLNNTGSHFKLSDILPDANWEGDDHAAELYNIVKKETFEKDTYERRFETKDVSPTEKEMEYIKRMKKGQSYEDLYPNQQGPVPTIKKGRNLNRMQNLGKPGKVDYKKAYDAFKQSDARNTFRDWDAAEAERRDQQTQQQKPMSPPQNTSGPVNTNQRRQQPQRPNVNNNEEDENWDEQLNNPNNNNF